MLAFISRLTPGCSLLLSWTVILFLSGCQSGSEPVAEEAVHDHTHEEEGHDHDHDHEDEEAEGHHLHVSPHGGTLVALGDHFAHAEVVVDSTQGVVTVYLLDGEAENPVRIAQESIQMAMSPRGATDGEPLRISLPAVANPLTGETVGDSSEFRIEQETLKDLQEFDGVLGSLLIKGTTLEEISFAFPEGNE